MQLLQKIGLMLFMLAFGLTSVSQADVAKERKRGQAVRTAKGNAEVGNCRAAQAESVLDVNNIRARVYNNGPLFYNGSANLYEVPKGSGLLSHFAGAVWVGGKVDGEIRISATDYGPYEFWAGPLDENGNPPADCSVYDRLYNVSKDDISLFEGTGVATADLRDWPFELGAEVVDGDGIEGNYNLAGGDRPAILGDQTIYWIMNDRGNVHEWAGTDAIGLQVQVYVFAFRSSGPLNETTFYRYVIDYMGDQPLEETWFGIWADVDLGQFNDDFVASDTVLGMGYQYNGEDDDDDYGSAPPAIGYDFFKGPIVDGEVLTMRRFMFYNNNSSVQGNPRVPSTDAYSYMSGFWQDGTPMTLGGNGYGGDTPVDFMYAGDPVTGSFWSEVNVDGAGSQNAVDDRRFVMSSGPFTMNPGDRQEIVYGIVWAQGADRFDSITKMREADALAQAAFDIGFALPPPPDPPQITANPADGKLFLNWGYGPNSNNYGGSYVVEDPLLAEDAVDRTYDFEGFVLRQYSNDRFSSGNILAVFDKANGVTRVIDGGDLTFVAAEGTDSGLEYSWVVENLTNYQDYYFTIQAYAYNEESSPKIYASPEARVIARPSKNDGRFGGARVQSEYEADLSAESIGVASDGTAGARVIDPTQITGDEYQVQFYRHMTPDSVEFNTYNIVNVTTGEIKVDGADLGDRTGQPLDQTDNAWAVDGITFDINGPQPDYKRFLTVANANGPIAEEEGAAADFQSFPSLRPSDAQQATTDGHWMIGTGDNGSRGDYDSFVARTTNGSDWDNRIIVPYDFEIRFTENGSYGYDPFCTGNVMKVPFELWRTGIATPDDPSDDVRMVPYVLDNDYSSVTGVLPGFALNTTASIQASSDDPAIGGPCASGAADHSGSGANNDPATDWWYWTTPTDDSPGEAGYLAWEAAALTWAEGDFGHYNELTTDNSIRRMVLFDWNGGDVDVGDYRVDFPEVGTIFRIITAKPNIPGTIFSVNTAGFDFVKGDANTARNAVDLIGITPNPYKGASTYEKSNFSRLARFINLPERATIRVFSLDGSLIRTLQKNGPAPELDWDLQTDASLPIASGMYLIHIEVNDASGRVTGEKVLKFGVVMPRVQLETF